MFGTFSMQLSINCLEHDVVLLTPTDLRSQPNLFSVTGPGGGGGGGGRRWAAAAGTFTDENIHQHLVTELVVTASCDPTGPRLQRIFMQ